MNWIYDAVMYHIYPLGFCGAPSRNTFDQSVVPRIQKVTDWIPHLTALGVNCIYFGPVFQSTAHGYDTADYYKIDQRLGSNQDFQSVCETLKEHGIRVVLDGVFNHVGRDFWAFKDVLEKREASPYCSWFANLNFGGNTPCNDGFWYEGWHGYYDLVKLNLHNPDVVRHLLDAVGMWMDKFGISGLRLDAADCVNADFFRQLRTYCKSKNESFWLMGEIIHGDYKCWANPSMLDSVTNYECHKGIYSSHNDKNYFEIAYSLNRQFGSGGIYKDLELYNFVDNHDVNRLASCLRNPKHLPLCYALLFGMTGIPSIYYGSEWGITGMRDKHSDAALRPCLELPPQKNYDTELCVFIGQLAHIRKTLSALRYGSYEQCLVKNHQFVFSRSTGDQKVCVALNLSEQSEYVEFRTSPGQMTDVLTGQCFESNDGNFKLELPAYGVRILCTPHMERDALLSNDEFPAMATTSVVPATDDEMQVLTEVKAGLYRHFKGNTYQVLGIAQHEGSGNKCVVYHPADNPASLWVREFDNFCEVVDKDGKKMLRFTPLF